MIYTLQIWQKSQKRFPWINNNLFIKSLLFSYFGKKYCSFSLMVF